MADLPQSTIDDANADIVSVISARVQLKKTGKNYSACCPFHNERSPSFSVSPSKGFFYCFGCGASGDAVKFVMDFESIPFRDAVERIVGNLPADFSQRREQLAVAAAKVNYPSSHRENPEKAATDLAKAIEADTHPQFISENTAPVGSVLTIAGLIAIPLINAAGEIVNVAALASNGKVFYSAQGISYGATARIPAALNADGRIALCQDYFDGWRLWWKLKGAAEIRVTVSPDNFLFISRKLRDQFNVVAVLEDDAEEYRELGFDVIVLPEVYTNGHP